MSLPSNKSQFQKKWKPFQDFLLARGSAILHPTNPYEIARFLTDSGIGVVYVNKNDRITNWIGGSDVAYQAFIGQKEWRATERTARSKKTLNEYRSISDRDGNGCMYCLTALSVDVATIEHVVPLASGGTNHLSNKALACSGCNREAGHLSVRQKIELAISKRGAA